MKRPTIRNYEYDTVWEFDMGIQYENTTYGNNEYNTKYGNNEYDTKYGIN